MLLPAAFKAELINDRIWNTKAHLELAIVAYIGWFNTDRLHSELGDLPPVELEALEDAPPTPHQLASHDKP